MPDNQSYARLSTPGSDAWASHGDCAAAATNSRSDLPLLRTPAGRPWHARLPTIASLPAPRVPAARCTDAAQTRLEPPGPRVRSGPFALDSACVTVVLASTSAGATTPHPSVSTSGAWPCAPSHATPSATRRRSGPRRRQAVCGPCPRCPFSPAIHALHVTFSST